MRSKAKQQVIHAQMRIGERLGLCVTKADLARWAADIRAGRYPLYEKQSNRRHLYEATINHTPVFLAYDRLRGNVVTVLFDRRQACLKS